MPENGNERQHNSVCMHGLLDKDILHKDPKELTTGVNKTNLGCPQTATQVCSREGGSRG